MDPLQEPQILYDLNWIFEPTALVGLLTLAVIQIVLAIDNLVFIAVLSAKLPPSKRAKARYIGIGGALVIRLVLLVFAAYIMALSNPLFTLFGQAFSVRDLVMFAGGMFLLYKSTEELHEKLEGQEEQKITLSRAGSHSLTLVAVQIMVLDALFSVDAIVTAVGMTSHVFIMMIAVTIAMGVMMWASGFVTEFLSRHPTLVILCLGFLLLIGFSLLMEALHISVPKGYLYAAIGFSILIEVLNQIARKNTLKLGKASAMQGRELAASLVLRLLGSKSEEVPSLREAIVSRTGPEVFNSQEKEMVSRVLTLSSLPVKAVMTVRADLQRINLDQEYDKLIEQVKSYTHTKLVVYQSQQKDQPLGYLTRSDLLALALKGVADVQLIRELIREPLYLPETVNILKALEEFRKAKKYIAFVFDEFGNFEGLVTLHDIMEEVAGELPDQTENPEIVKLENGQWQIEGDAILTDIARITGFSLPPSDHYQTIAGFILDYLQRIPEQGEQIQLQSWIIKVVKTSYTSIEVVKLRKLKR
ncbi:MAG: TerC family protein [Succinivibrio sp.]|nr:TerC family protein [Succinivibrio sp.]